jgi:galactokinase
MFLSHIQAIERDTVVAVKVRAQSNELRIANVDQKFSSKVFSKEYKDIVIDPSKHEWTNYTLAAYKVYLIILFIFVNLFFDICLILGNVRK